MTILVTFLLASKLYSRKEGLISGVVVSFCPILYFVSGRIWIDALFIFLAVLSFYLLIIAVERNSLLCIAISGLVFGLSLLAKYASLGIFPALIYYLWAKRTQVKNIILFSLLFLAVSSLIILPWLFYYYKVLGNGSYVCQFKLNSEIIDMFPFCKTISQRPFYFYFVRIFLVAPVYIFSLGHILMNKKNRGDCALIIWVFSFFVGFTLLGMLKIGGYVLRYIAPATPALSILAARFITNRKNVALITVIILLVYGLTAGMLSTLNPRIADVFPVTYFIRPL
jgi:4-amino-4-deoxy-L-arabinose transferase-like glycosyltransferase